MLESLCKCVNIAILVNKTRDLHVGGSANPRSTLNLLSFIALASFLAAWGSEYYGGLKACSLCYIQRYFFVAIMIGSTTLSLFKPYWQKKGLAVLGILFVINGTIGAYQVLIEQGYLEPPSICKSSHIKADTVEELRAQLKKTRPVSCNEVQWSFLGISMAGYNFIWCIFWSLVCFRSYRQLCMRKFLVK